MKRMKKPASLLLACVLLCPASIAAFAQEISDPDKTGSISLTMAYEGEAVPGGTLTAYQVGELSEDDGKYYFTLSLEFAAMGVDLNDISSSELAEELADYAAEKELTGTKEEVGADGKAEFSDLEWGLYLLVQTEAAKGYEAVSPFLVSVPTVQDNTYVYAVDATPKMETLKKVTEEPVNPTPPPADSTLPQTGQLNWPIPVLTALGLCLFLIGWTLRYGRNRKANET